MTISWNWPITIDESAEATFVTEACKEIAYLRQFSCSGGVNEGIVTGTSNNCRRLTFRTWSGTSVSPRRSSLGTPPSVAFASSAHHHHVEVFQLWLPSCRPNLLATCLYSAHVPPRRRSATPPALRWWRFKVYDPTLSTRKFQRLEGCQARLRKVSLPLLVHYHYVTSTAECNELHYLAFNDCLYALRFCNSG